MCTQGSGCRAPAKNAGVHAQVIGCAIALSLLTWGAVPLWAGVLVTAVDSFALLLIERLGVRNLEAVFAVLITTMAVSFGVMYVLAGVPTAEVVEGARQVQGLAGRFRVHPVWNMCAPCLVDSHAHAAGLLVPRVPRSAVSVAVALVGAVIMCAPLFKRKAHAVYRKQRESLPVLSVMASKAWPKRKAACKAARRANRDVCSCRPHNLHLHSALVQSRCGPRAACCFQQ